MQNSIALDLNNSQARIHLINSNVMHFLGPRGTGKTQGGIGPRLMHLSSVMPRSQCVLASDTYDRLETVITGGVVSFLTTEMGLVEDQDFVVFKRPPANWIKPIIIPRKFDRAISFNTGFTVMCAGLFKDGSTNGIDAQSAIIDETKWVPESRMKSQLFKALRGQFRRWGRLPEYRSVWTFTDKYDGDIDWILDLRDKQDERLIQAVLTKAVQINEWRNKLALLVQTQASESTIYRLKAQIIEAERKLNLIRKELVYVCDAQPFENIDILGEKYYRDAKRDCESQEEYDVAILNKDPKKIKHPYYPDFTEANLYDQMDDIDQNKPLIISMDYNWRIVCVEIAQIGKRRGETFDTLNVVGSAHAEEPAAGIPEAIKNFDELMAGHRKRMVYYVYDNTAIGRDAGRKPLRDLVINELKAKKWKVKKVYIGSMTDHHSRFHKLQSWLTNRGLMAVMVNRHRADAVINSINRTGAITSAGKTKKDKKPETDMKIPARNAPHHSEAFDQLLCAVLERKMIKASTAKGTVIKGN
ncbi:MAG: hypothetical protein JO301_17055 [Chitinophagaceae bacterium]|nr:hypothetical protein [Chitinophagaceae bacterium]